MTMERHIPIYQPHSLVSIKTVRIPDYDASRTVIPVSSVLPPSSSPPPSLLKRTA